MGHFGGYERTKKKLVAASPVIASTAIRAASSGVAKITQVGRELRLTGSRPSVFTSCDGREVPSGNYDIA